MLAEGGNAVDAAVAAVLASFTLESALTGLGAGGFEKIWTFASAEFRWTGTGKGNGH